MDENVTEQVRALIPALKALQDSVKHAAYNNVAVGGVVKMAVKSYTRLHGKIAELLPDDDYITDVLVLDINDNDKDEAKVAQLELATNQLIVYLRAKVHDDRSIVDKNEIKQLGRELQDQVMNFTRTTLRRALSSIDEMPVPPVPPTPPVPPRPGMTPPGPKIRVEIHRDEGDDEKPKNTPPDIV
jgi:hypothetical protein